MILTVKKDTPLSTVRAKKRAENLPFSIISARGVAVYLEHLAIVLHRVGRLSFR